MKSSIELFDRLTRERGQVCEVCHARIATELHHCLYHRRAGVKELDTPENLELVCNLCHADGVVNSYKHRVQFYVNQCSRYGSQHMEDWNNGLPIKRKDRWV